MGLDRINSLLPNKKDNRKFYLALQNHMDDLLFAVLDFICLYCIYVLSNFYFDVVTSVILSNLKLLLIAYNRLLQ